MVFDYHKGEAPKAFVVLRTGFSASARELIAFMRVHLANYKVPRHIEFRNSLLHNTAGKILKRVLIEKENKKTGPIRAQ